MPLTGGQKTNYANLISSIDSLKGSLSTVDPDQSVLLYQLCHFEVVVDLQMKGHKDK